MRLVVRGTSSCGPPGYLDWGAAGRQPQHFVESMLRLARERDGLRVVADQHCTPTSVPQLSRAIEFLLRNDRIGNIPRNEFGPNNLV